MPDNDSSTGGFLRPGPGRFRYEFILTTDPHYWDTDAPLDGQTLENLLHQIIQGITGLPPELVRPWIQPEPSPLPPWGVDWISLQIASSDLDAGWPYEMPEPPPAPPNWVDPPSEGVYYNQHEFFNLTCASYGPNAEWFDGLLRDGFALSQNRELLRLTAMGLTRIGGGRLVPELIQQRWQRRFDRTFRLHREIRRLYPILNVLSSGGEIIVEGRHPADFGPGFVDDTVE